MAKKSKPVVPIEHSHPLPDHSHELLVHVHPLEAHGHPLEQHEHKHDHGAYSVKAHEHEHQHEHGHPKTAEIVRALLDMFRVGQINSAQMQGIEVVKRLLGDPAVLCRHENTAFEEGDVLVCQDCREVLEPSSR